MIERKFVAQKLKELQIQDYVTSQLGKVGHSKIEIKKTPLGEKIVIYSSRPGIIVGKKGENIRKLTTTLKNKFKLDNPQIEIGDVQQPLLDASAVADKIAYTLERYGAKRFKFIGYDMLQQIMNAGAIGGEVVISGKVPSARAKSWRFYAGYLKKSGDVAVSHVRKATTIAILKPGVVGIKVSIMPSGIQLPDKIIINPEVKVQVQEMTKDEQEEIKTEEKKKTPKKKKESSEKKEEVKEKKRAPKKKEEKTFEEKKKEEPKETAKEETSEVKEQP